jgi:hypothetical protein
VATLNFAANSSYQAVLNTVVLTFSGGAVTGSPNFSVSLIDANTNATLGASVPATCTVAGTCTATFNPAFTIDAGSTKATKVRVNSSAFTNGASVTDSMSVTVNGVNDVTISDGTSGGASIPLESTLVPFSVVNVSYE